MGNLDPVALFPDLAVPIYIQPPPAPEEAQEAAATAAAWAASRAARSADRAFALSLCRIWIGVIENNDNNIV